MNETSELPFGFDEPEDSPGFLLWQTTIMWQRLIKKTLEPHDLSHAQFVIMALLLWFESHGYDTHQILIVKWSKLDKMTVSLALKKLSERGLVKRTEDESDTRAKRVSITDLGKSLVFQIVPLVEKIDADFFAILGDQQADFTQLLKKTATQNNHI